MAKNKKERVLRKFGLTRNEVKVYLTLLEMGRASAGEITEKLPIHRRNVYDILERLIEKGLVSFVIDENKRVFSSTGPEKFSSLLKEEENKLKNKKRQLTEILPELEALKTIKEEEKQEVNVFKGKEGIKNIYNDILNLKKDYAYIGPKGKLSKIMKAYFKEFSEKRAEEKIHGRYLFSDLSYKKTVSKKPFIKIRMLHERFSPSSALIVYDAKVAVILISGEMPISIVIENKELAEDYREYFEILWKASKP